MHSSKEYIEPLQNNLPDKSIKKKQVTKQNLQYVPITCFEKVWTEQMQSRVHSARHLR